MKNDTRVLELTVPKSFDLPATFHELTPEATAAVLLCAAAIHRSAGEVGPAEELHAQLREARERVSALEARRAADVAPLVEQAVRAATESQQALIDTLRDAVAEHRAGGQLTQSMQALERTCVAEFARLSGSSRLKGQLGETNITTQLSQLCPDSVVEHIGDDEDHRGDVVWTRHFGSAALSMSCMVEVKNVTRVRAEDITAFQEHFDCSRDAGRANCALLLSLQAVTFPATRGRVRYSPFFALDWRRGAPLMYVSNLNSNPDMLSVALACMQHVWQFCDRVGAFGATGAVDGEQEHMVTLVNNFVNEQYALHHAALDSAQTAETQLTALLRDCQRRITLHREQIDNIGSRLAETLGAWVRLKPSEAPASRRRRNGVAIAEEELTEDQRRIVTACREFMASPPHRLTAADINAGKVHGVGKYDVDTLFSNFTTLKKTVAALRPS